MPSYKRRRREQLPPPPREKPHKPQPKPLAVLVRWALPPDTTRREAEHAADLAVMRGAVLWWDWRGEVLVASCVRVREALATMASAMGAPMHDPLSV